MAVLVDVETFLAAVALRQIEHIERRFLSVDEIQDLADAIDDRYRLMVLSGGYAGLRFGELATLRVSSFRVGLRTVTVTETLTDVGGVVRIGPPKTRASVRTACRPSQWSNSSTSFREIGCPWETPAYYSPPPRVARSARPTGGVGSGLRR